MPLRGAPRSMKLLEDGTRASRLQILDRGRKSRLSSAPPPSEPYRRISRIRLSGWWCDLKQDGPTSPRRGQSLAGFSQVSPPYFHPRKRIVHMPNFDSDRFLCLATAEAAPTRLAQRHSRRLGFDPHLRYASTFLRSLRSLSITRVPRYYGRSDSWTTGSSAHSGA